MKVYELYSGIGGMHFALKKSEIDAEVLKAIDINNTANSVYKLNFPNTVLLEKNIQCLTKKDFDGIDMILMSPPCQPHTRNGLKKDKLDERSISLLHILSLLPQLSTIKYILLENVKGFEESEMRNDLIKVLNDSEFIYQEFLLTPKQFSIPNSRLRYYLLAKKKPMKFCFFTKNYVMEKLPLVKNNEKLDFSLIQNDDASCFPIKLILQNSATTLIPEKVLEKYGKLFDIVTSESTNSCCFTKAYSNFVEGTGSVYSPKSIEKVNEVLNELEKFENDSNESLNLLKSLQLRYFTPQEISRLMSFPNEFKFPDNLSQKQKYRLLGNSINVHVVAILIKLLVN